MCGKRQTLGWPACFCELDSVFSASLSPIRAANGAACHLHVLQGALYDGGLPRSIKDFHLICVSVTSGFAGQRTPRRGSVAECWPQTLFCSFLHYCPAKSWSECSVHRKKLGARHVSLSSRCFFSYFICFFFPKKILCFFWWVYFNLLTSGVPGKESKKKRFSV